MENAAAEASGVLLGGCDRGWRGGDTAHRVRWVSWVSTLAFSQKVPLSLLPFPALSCALRGATPPPRRQTSASTGRGSQHAEGVVIAAVVGTEPSAPGL